MPMISAPRLIFFTVTFLLISCGGGLLYPLWSKDHAASGTGKKVFTSDDKQSIYVVSGLHGGMPLQVLQYDLAGNLISTEEYGELTVPNTATPLEGNRFYLHPRFSSLESAQLFDLNDNSSRPAFTHYPFDGYAYVSLNILKLDAHNNLIINGSIREHSGDRTTGIIGILSTDGQFSYQTLRPHMTSERIYENENGTGYVIHAATTYDYANTNGIETVIMFLDEHLNIKNTIEYAEAFRSAFAFNNVLYGRFRGGPQDSILVSIQQDGTLTPAPNELTGITSAFGEDHFYQLGYKEDNFKGKREICRFNYEPRRLNCFYLSIEGEYRVNARVLDDGALAIAEYGEGNVYESAGINLDNIDDAVVGEFIVKGYFQRQHRQRTVSPEGELILDAKPEPFKEVGYFEVCDSEWVFLTNICLVTEDYEAGTCSMDDYEFLDRNRLVTLTQHCQSDTDRSNRINYWEAAGLGSN